MKNLISHNLKVKKRNKISDLSTIFDSFNSHAQKLEASYKQLQDRIREIDREMAQTNECLNKKVQELNNLTRYLNSILESMYCGVVAIDIQGRIEAFNRSAEKILHIKARDVIGKNVPVALTQINGFHNILVESSEARKNVTNLQRLIE